MERVRTKKKRVVYALYIGSSGTPASVETIQKVIDAITTYEEEESVSSINKTVRGYPLYKTIFASKYEGRRLELLNQLLKWATGDAEEDLFYSTWDDAVQAASVVLRAEQALKGLSSEELATRAKELSSILGDLASTITTDIDESSLSSEKRQKLSEEVLPKLRQAASDVTDIFVSGLAEFTGDESDKLPLGVHRRKWHHTGSSQMPGYKISYRTYTEGTISPLSNAFILGGSLPGDYGPLFKALIATIAAETKDLEQPWGDREIAMAFLREFNGENAFKSFSEDAQKLAHKLIAIMLFAEQARHSIALVSAASAFFAVATRKDAPGLVESFETGSDSLRPLFAGTGGPSLMRGDEVAELSLKEILTRTARAAIDLNAYFEARKDEGEDISTFIKRRTFQFVVNLSQHSSHGTKEIFETMSVVPVLVDLLKRIVKTKSKTGDTLTTLAALGFTHHPQPGNANNCAIESMYDQLQHHLTLGDGGYAAFAQYIRDRINVPFGQMVDLTTHGQALLAATQSYLNETHTIAQPLVLDLWAATGDGGLMEFRNVAQADGFGDPIYITFYYNGVNHFDSLVGGPPRG